MDNRLKNIKEEMDEFISPNNFFNEDDKRAVRRKIRELSITKSKQNRLVPLIMSFAAVAVFFFLIGGFIGKQLGLNSKEKSVAQKNEQISEPSEIGGIIFDPKTLQEGIQIGGMQVKSVSPSARYFPVSPFQAVFEGSVTVSGMFHYIEESQELLFYPDKKEAKKLPAPEGAVRIPIISIANFAENKDEVLELLEINPEKRALGNVTLTRYHMDFRSTGEQIDSADISAINATELSLEETGNTGVLNDIPLTYDIIPKELVPIYENFYKTGDDEVLKNLGPDDIFLMFWQAVSLGHTVTIYELLNQDDPDSVNYQAFIDHVYEKESKTLQIELEKIQNNLDHLYIETIENKSRIGVNPETTFPLKKDKNDIWKVEYFF